MWLSNIVLTPGKPNSYSPKPTRDTKGTAERGLKNLKKELELISLDEFTSIQKNVYFFHYPVYGFYGYINSMAQATQTCQHNLFQKAISKKRSLYITIVKKILNQVHISMLIFLPIYEDWEVKIINYAANKFKHTLQHFARGH